MYLLPLVAWHSSRRQADLLYVRFGWVGSHHGGERHACEGQRCSEGWMEGEESRVTVVETVAGHRQGLEKKISPSADAFCLLYVLKYESQQNNINLNRVNISVS